MKKMVLGLIFLASTMTFAAWESRSIPNETIIKASEHFEIRTKPKHDDGTANNVVVSEAAASAALATLEEVFIIYHNNLGFRQPFEGKPVQYKTRAYIYQNIDALYGGEDSYGPGLWLGLGSLADKWGLAHEYTHGLQSNAGGLGNTAHAGWAYEAHANWMAHQYIPSDAHCSEMLVNFPYLYYGSTRDRYCNWQYFEYFKDTHGLKEFNRIWTESKRGSEQVYQTPFTAIQFVQGWDLATLNADFGNWAQRNVTWDYGNGSVYRSRYGDYELGTRRNSRSTDRHTRVTMMNQLDEANNRYISPDYWAPQRYGYNIVRLYPDAVGANSTITLNFRGVVQAKNAAAKYTCLGNLSDRYDRTYNWCNLIPDVVADPGSSWSWGLVAVSSDGTPRYSELQSGTASDLSFDVKANDKGLYMVVVATPTVEQTILWDQFYYSIYRYPYMIGLKNAKPEGFQANAWTPANATNFVKHSNGGGLVSKTANVAASVYVGPNAVVTAGTISGNVRIEDFAVINGGTITGNAVVRGRALVTAGTISDDAVLEEDAWLVSGTIKENAKVGALSVIKNSTVSGSAKYYGVMWPLSGKTLTGTGQLRGDLEMNFSATVNAGVFYGILFDGDLGNAKFGANLTAPPTDVTAPIIGATWWDPSGSTAISSAKMTEQKWSIVALGQNQWQVQCPKGTESLLIMDLKGRLISQYNVTSVESQVVSLDNQAKGAYFLVARGSFGSLVQKMIK